MMLETRAAATAGSEAAAVADAPSSVSHWSVTGTVIAGGVTVRCPAAPAERGRWKSRSSSARDASGAALSLSGSGM